MNHVLNTELDLTGKAVTGMAVGAVSARPLVGATAGGQGAWKFYYRKGQTFTTDREKAGIFAIKQELIYCGYGKNVDLTVMAYGDAMYNRAREFQKAAGLIADGVIGPNTARVLFRLRASQIETAYGIPAGYLQKQKTLESANDPVAEGWVDPDDEGLMQIHLPFYPFISIKQAWDPAFCINFAGQMFANAYASFGDWDGALASYNTGWYYARKWVEAGKPASGMLVGTLDWFTRATNYVAVVKKQPL